MAWIEDLTKVPYIVMKDIKTYYFKPPNISWGILFPAALVLAFSIRNPSGIRDMIPGLVGMSVLFGTTSMCAIVITFEKRIGSLERLLLAPISVEGIILGKILGGTLFGMINGVVMVLFSIFFLSTVITDPFILIAVLILSALEFSAFGASIASMVKEVFEAQTLSNFFRFPMIFLCGVFISVHSLPSFIRPSAYILPLTCVVDALRYCLIGQYEVLPPVLAFIISLGYTLCFFALSVRVLARRAQ
ncbi:MAG: ABC transporter permease [Candidatus Heimdallarchaeota archaeon]